MNAFIVSSFILLGLFFYGAFGVPRAPLKGDEPERTNNAERRIRRANPEPEPECHPSMMKDGKCPDANQKSGSAVLKTNMGLITVAMAFTRYVLF